MNIDVEFSLTHSTVRIEVPETDKQGTGFFYKINFGGPNAFTKVYIATNRHIVEGATAIRYVMSTASDVRTTDEAGVFPGEVHHTLETSLGRTFHGGVAMDILFAHPDPEVDLVLIDVTIPLGLHLATTKLRLVSLDRSWLPQPGDRRLRSIENLKIVGYPLGMWDAFNNRPIARSGSTATHPLAKFEGKSNFLVDGAVFDGSSGSPVFCYESPMYKLPDGGFSPGTKAVLLGVLWAVLEVDTQGRMVIEQISAADTGTPVLKTSLHMGVALQARHLLDIEEMIDPGVTTRAPFAAAQTSPTSAVPSPIPSLIPPGLTPWSPGVSPFNRPASV